jgi:deoxyribodipyrimidine photo-lyase
MAAFEDFISSGRLKLFADKRNDPNIKACSDLSPYFHFGHISVQRVVYELKSRKMGGASVDSFIEEAVVRRELSDNFCYYNKKYDSLDGCYEWARTTLDIHASDPREHLYTREQLAKAKTHDDLWNAAQLQLRLDGKMHGFLRMYWAKKILEWTSDPDTALSTALYLNDRFSLDGRDPNGFVGCMWSIGGVHDQGWGERSVFGKIRYMNYAGCKRKFDVSAFVGRMANKLAKAKKEAIAKAAAAKASDAK